MKRNLRNKLIIAFAIVALFIGSTQVLAVNSLESTIMHIVRSISAMKGPDVEAELQSKASAHMEQNRSEIISYIDSATDRVISNIDQHIAVEAERIGQEFDDFLSDLKSKIDKELQNEEQRLKNVSTQKIDAYIEELKVEIYYDLFDELNNYINDLFHS